MGSFAPTACYITGEPTRKLISDVDAIEYYVTYNGHEFLLRFSNEIHYESPIAEGEKNVLKALLFNNAWPIEQDTFITRSLLNRIISNSDYPRSFPAKLEYCLMLMYLEGGGEYKGINIKNWNFQKIYADDQSEFNRVINGIVQKGFAFESQMDSGLITQRSQGSGIFKLTEEGIHAARILISKKEKRKVRFDPQNSPRVYLCYSDNEDDKKFAARLTELLGKRQVTLYDVKVNNDLYGGQVYNERQTIVSDELDFFIFIQSYHSNQNNNLNDIGSIAIEQVHKQTENQFTIYVAKIDDSPISQSRLSNFSIMDIRLKSEREDFVDILCNDWVNKLRTNGSSSKKVGFSEKVELTVSDKETNSTSNQIFLETTSEFKITDKAEGVIGVFEQAKIFSELLNNLESGVSAIVGIFGQWGRGKTFFWSKLNSILKENKSKDYRNITFHAWKYQDTPASWAYLYEVLVDAYLQIEPSSSKCLIIKVSHKIWAYLNKSIKILYLNFKRKGLWPIIKFFCVLGFGTLISFAFAELHKKDIVSNIVKYLGISGGIVIGLFGAFATIYKDSRIKAKDLIKGYSNKHSFAQHLGIQAEVEKEIKILLKAWVPIKYIGLRKITLFVDDLDRCFEEKIIEVIDSLRVMVDNETIAERLIVIAAIDERVLLRAIENKYSKILDYHPEASRSGRTILLRREYMDKLFLLGIKLHELTKSQKDEILDAFTKNKQKVNFKTLPSSDTNEVRSDSKNIAATVSDEMKDDKSNEVNEKEEFTESSQLNEIEYVEGNPDYDIEEFEYQMLKNTLESLNFATPRSIRIYYYRYLLAKKLLKSLLDKDNVAASKWKVLGDKRIVLPQLIIEYSNLRDIETLSTDRASIHGANPSDFIVRVLSDSGINKELLIMLLNVVEMVVPY